jgi:hypothetical protein
MTDTRPHCHHVVELLRVAKRVHVQERVEIILHLVDVVFCSIQPFVATFFLSRDDGY